MVHEDTEIITEECASDSELPGGGNDEYLAKSEEYGRDDDVQRFRKEWYVWLFRDGFLEPSEECISEINAAKVRTSYKLSRSIPPKKIEAARK